jgi:hypothetical protein
MGNWQADDDFDAWNARADRFDGFDRGDDARTEHAEWQAAENERMDAEEAAQ